MKRIGLGCGICVISLGLMVGAAALTGCGSGGNSVTTPGVPTPLTPSASSYPGVSFNSGVAAGTTPVVGSTVQLYAAGTTGNGSGATALGAALTSDTNGNVTIAAQYDCPSASSELYVVSRGGNVGSSASGGLDLMAALGPCDGLTSAEKIVINEVTTVAAMYALAPFYSAGGNVGASATNTVGIGNAFLTAAELANVATGTSPGLTLPGNVASPAARINALANAVNACAAASSGCTALFSAATVGTIPANTLDALYNVVRHPANNVGEVYEAASARSVYLPSLAAAPSDWTLFLTISGGGLTNSVGQGNSPSGLAVDSQGDVWVATYFGSAAKFTPLGAAVFANGVTGGGLNNSFGMAIDGNDDAWIPSEPSTVSKLSSTGASLAGSGGFVAGGLNFPVSTAIDPNGTVWVVDYGDSYVTLLNASGVPISGPNGYTTTQFSFPVAVAVDGNHFGWVANQSSDLVTKVAPDGSSFTSYTCGAGPSGLAVDQADNIWVANYYGNSLSLVSSAGVVTGATFTDGGGIDHPQGIAVDGAGNVWVANYRAPYISELTGTTSATPGQAISPAAGYGADAALSEAYALAVDASGSVWVSSFGSSTVTRYIGLASPVKTPVSGMVQQP